MSRELRKQIFASAKSLVVKFGSSVLSDDDGSLDEGRIGNLAEQVFALRQSGRLVTVVSSGAIGAGLAEMGLPQRPSNLPQLQACAAVGQTQLMRAFQAALKPRGCHTAQMLLTRGDFDDRTRYLNARNCIHALLDYGAIPIINENDTVSVDEIRLGDNDILAAMVTNMLCADVLILLTVVDGLYSDAAGGEVLDIVTDGESLKHLIDSTRSPLGVGGMATKLEAIASVNAAGESAVIANGRRPDVLTDIVDGKVVGTLFVPTKAKMAGRKRWIGLTSRPRGKLIIDDGAAMAILNRKSMLASGITKVEGNFERGDVVALLDTSGKQLACGLSNYSSDEVDRVKGLKTSQFKDILGEKPYDEIIHVDNMVITD
ncbi:MAG: glutamate 5-kinase [Planctomycetia bacterium]|nr:glutamate 5-kinase [Planctomycetia bacterium]